MSGKAKETEYASCPRVIVYSRTAATVDTDQRTASISLTETVMVAATVTATTAIPEWGKGPLFNFPEQFYSSPTAASLTRLTLSSAS